jgi:DNA-binding transcriptional LysR family regulator
VNNESKPKDSILGNWSARVDLRHLQYAVTVEDCGSFRAAAEVLSLTQPTLSRCIRQLEHAIGLAVFERSSGGARPTRSGRDFLRTARLILDQMEMLVTQTRRTGRGEAGRLVIGFYTSLSTGNLRATLADFRERHPQVELEMIERSRARLLAGLRNGAIDIVIVTGAALVQDTELLPLWSERTFIALPEGHSLAGRDSIYWTDLRGERLLLSHYDPGREFEDS